MPTFHEFASEWYARRERAGLRPRTLEHMRWCLSDHLLPTLRAFPLDKIDAEAIDAFTARSKRQGPVGDEPQSARAGGSRRCSRMPSSTT
jgi:hypothetical protein